MEPQSGGFELETPDLSSALLKLAQLRHARGIELAQVASRREFSHQVHEDKVIAEFLAWNPPGNIRRM